MDIWFPTDENELNQFVTSAGRSENRDFDFKEILPRGASSREGKEVIVDEYLKSFCAFANAKGGTLIIGVSEDRKTKKREICPIKNAKEANKDISDIVDKRISPQIPGWYIHTFDLKAQTGCVLFIEIPASPSFIKPHMYNHKVYYRLPGTCEPVHGDGPKVREICELDHFSPGACAAFEIFSKIFLKSADKLNQPHERYYLNLFHFLHENRLRQELEDVYPMFEKVMQVHAEFLNSLLASNSASLGTAPVDTPASLLQKRNEAFGKFSDKFLDVLRRLK